MPLIVGAGVIGLACAWRAAERGLDVVVLERARPGAGASDVAAGMLAPVAEATWGEERLLELALESHRLWPRIRAGARRGRAGREIGFLGLGALHVALDRDEAAELRRRFELMRSLDLAAEWVSPQACRELEPGLGTVAGGIMAPHEAAVDPRALVGALAAALSSAGGRIETAEVSGPLLESGRLVGVRSCRRTLLPGGLDRARRGRLVGRGMAAGRRAAADPAGQGPDPDPSRSGAGAGLRADRGHRARLPGSARGWAAGRRGDRRGTGIRPPGDRGRRPRTAPRGLPSPARGRRARAGRGGRGPAAGDARQHAVDRPGSDRRAWCSRPATTATGSCSPRSPPSAWSHCSRERRARPRRWPDDDRAQRGDGSRSSRAPRSPWRSSEPARGRIVAASPSPSTARSSRAAPGTRRALRDGQRVEVVGAIQGG